MEVKFSGINNNRPVLQTYHLSEQPVGEAVGTKIPGRFKVSCELQPLKCYAIVDEELQCVGMIVRHAPRRNTGHQATLCSFMKEWIPKKRYQVHTLQFLDEDLDY